MPDKTLNYEVTKCSTIIYITTVKILFYMYIDTEEMHYNTGGYAVENSNFLSVADTVYNKNIHFVLIISILIKIIVNYIQIYDLFKNTLDTLSFFAQMIK